MARNTGILTLNEVYFVFSVIPFFAIFYRKREMRKSPNSSGVAQPTVGTRRILPKKGQKSLLFL